MVFGTFADAPLLVAWHALCQFAGAELEARREAEGRCYLRKVSCHCPKLPRKRLPIPAAADGTTFAILAALRFGVRIGISNIKPHGTDSTLVGFVLWSHGVSH